VVSVPNDVVLHVLASKVVASRTRVKIGSGKVRAGHVGSPCVCASMAASSVQ